MDGGDAIEITVLGGLGEIAAADWDACAGAGGRAAARPLHHPPLPARARGLRARSAAAPAGRRATSSPAQGGAAIAVMPLYAKGHSQGEYIFDHNWAHAWERAGGRYYPKLQAAVPFTPATGRRFLTRPGPRGRRPRRAAAGRADARRAQPASRALHVTFCTAEERAWGDERRPARAAPPSSSTGRTAATPTSTPSSPTSPRASARRSARSARGRRPSAARSSR